MGERAVCDERVERLNGLNVLNQVYSGGGMITLDGEEIEVIDAHSHMGSRNKLAVHQIPPHHEIHGGRHDDIHEWGGG